LECPQTEANENGMGCAGKDKSAPQQLLTMLLHLGTGLPWGFARGPGTGSEREQLGRMLIAQHGRSVSTRSLTHTPQAEGLASSTRGAVAFHESTGPIASRSFG